jgi:hypothetical protein
MRKMHKKLLLRFVLINLLYLSCCICGVGGQRKNE